MHVILTRQILNNRLTFMFLTTYNGTYTKLIFIGLTVVWKKC